MKLRVLLILLCVGAMTACTHKSEEVANPAPDMAVSTDKPIELNEEQSRRIDLQTAHVESRHFPISVSLPGVIQANNNMSTPVISLVPGRIEDVFVKQGDGVNKGSVLACLRSDEVGQIENDFVAKTLELQSDRKVLHVKEDLEKKVYQRKKLLMEEKIGAAAEMEAAENDLEQTEAEMKSIDEKLSSTKSATLQRLKLFGVAPAEVDRVERTKEIQHLFDIRAPRNGIIASRDVDTGEMIEPGKPIFRVADLSTVWLVAQVPENEVSRIRIGMPVTVTVESFPNEKFHGVLDYLDSNLDPTTRTLPVRATISNKSRRLKPEMFARLNVDVDTTHSLVVPSEAVQKIGEVSVVYIQTSPHVFQEKKVTVGRTFGEYVEVLAGLTPSETVVTRGSLHLLGQALKRLSQ